MNVLFVDDELKSGLRETYDSLIKYYGHENIFPFLDAYEAKQFLNENPLLIDLAIIDEKLIGNISGLQLGSFISNHLPHIAMVMLTAYAGLEICQEAMRTGFCDFLDKSKVIKLEENLYNELDRIAQLASVKAKRAAKADLQRANNNWDSYIQMLSQKGTGWYAYNKTSWMLICKAFSVVPGLEQNQINHLLPCLQDMLVKYFPREEKFSFERLRALRENDRSNTLAEKWLPIIETFCTIPFTPDEEKKLKALKQRQGAGKNIFTKYLNDLLNNQRLCNQTIFLLHQNSEKFVILTRFSSIKRIKEDYLDKKIVPRL